MDFRSIRDNIHNITSITPHIALNMRHDTDDRFLAINKQDGHDWKAFDNGYVRYDETKGSNTINFISPTLILICNFTFK